MLFRVSSPSDLELGRQCGREERQVPGSKNSLPESHTTRLKAAGKGPDPKVPKGIAVDGMAHWPREELATNVLINTSLCISHLISQQRKTLNGTAVLSMLPQGAQRIGGGRV